MAELAEAFEALVQVPHLVFQVRVLLVEYVLLHVALQRRYGVLVDLYRCGWKGHRGERGVEKGSGERVEGGG